MSERVEQLLQSGNTASGRVRGLWITFVLFGAYLAIAVGGTTHRQMLLEAPTVLPILNANLGLVAFYRVAPVLFLIFHLYMLLQLYILGQKLHALDGHIETDIRVRSDRVLLRQRADPFLIAQLLVGKPGNGLTRFSLRVAAWLTVIAAPILLLLAIQIRFLPYHDVETTWLHRAVILLDLVLIWLFWPAVTRHKGRFGGALTALVHVTTLKLRPTRPQGGQTEGSSTIGSRALAAFSTATASMAAIATAALAGFSLLCATVPDEAMERWILRQAHAVSFEDSKSESLFHPAAWMTRRPRHGGDASSAFIWTPTAILFEGTADDVSSTATSLFARNLILIDDKELVQLDEGSLQELDRTLVLRGRDLRYARFDRTDLRKADLTSAEMQGAILVGARIQGAILAGAQMQGAKLSTAQMQSANLRNAQMQGASLSNAQMQGAFLSNAQMQGAKLSSAKMQGAYLPNAQMQGAVLTNAQMQGAFLSNAQMQDANLSGVQMQGAVLIGTRMQGANLSSAKMQGADLSNAEMQGANLENAQMQGAVLMEAHMQGANLSSAKMQGAVLSNAEMQGATLKNAQMQGVVLIEAQMQGAFLMEAQMQGADIMYAEMQGADLRHARLWNVDVRFTDFTFADGRATTYEDPIKASGPTERAAAARKQIDMWLHGVPKGDRQAAARARLATRLQSVAAPTRQSSDWGRARAPPVQDWSDDLYRDAGAFLGNLACGAENSPYIAHGIARRLHFGLIRNAVQPHDKITATHMLDDNCRGAKNLAKNLKSILRKIAKNTKP